MPTAHGEAHRVVVVGGGFGGLQATLGLRRAPVEITLVDRRKLPPVPAADLPDGDRRAVAGGGRSSAARDLQARPERARRDGGGRGLRSREARGGVASG